ncbi:MAG: hypothetical protein WCG66_05780 [bacterium]
MKAALDRDATQIRVVETRTSIDEGLGSTSETREVFLEAVIEDFLLKLGQSSAHVLGVVIQLLTRGKVRVDFRDYNIRLELGPLEKLLQRSEAVALFEDHIKRHQTTVSGATAEVTQKIMVQAPKVSLPKVSLPRTDH